MRKRFTLLVVLMLLSNISTNALTIDQRVSAINHGNNAINMSQANNNMPEANKRAEVDREGHSLHTDMAKQYQEAGLYLRDLSIIKGDQSGDLNAFSNLTREEGIVILVRMVNEEGAALKMGAHSGFFDIPEHHWAAQYIAYAEQKNWTNGIGHNKFGVGQYLTTKEFVSLMLRALNHTANWSREDIMAKAEGLGLLNGLAIKGHEPSLRGSVFIIMKNTLNTNVKGSNQLLLENFTNNTGLSTTSANASLSSSQIIASGNHTMVVNTRNANVEFVVRENDSKITVDYDKKANYIVTMQDLRDKCSINITSRTSENPALLALVKINIPAKLWKKIEINASNSKISANKTFKSAEIDAVFSFSQGYLELDYDFKGAIDLIVTNTSMDLVSQDEFKDASFNITSLGAVNLPNRFRDRQVDRTGSLPVEMVVSAKSLVNVK